MKRASGFLMAQKGFGEVEVVEVAEFALDFIEALEKF